jgi:Zn-dependent protease/predicted transcriptional regulator
LGAQAAERQAMLRQTIVIGRISGIAIEVDYSFFLAVGLVTWILAVSYYPIELTRGDGAQYWAMGAVTALLLFASVLLHELGHSVIARRFGKSVPRIVLFVFGGVSEMTTDTPEPISEFWIALAGPLVSFLLALLLWEMRPLVLGAPVALAITKYLAILNLMVGLFNLLPGFPLDGGRVFRAILWRMTGNLQKASKVTSLTGQFTGFTFIFLGVAEMFGGNIANGLWIAFIGWFLESAAAEQGRAQIARALLSNHKVSEVMTKAFPRVSGNLTLQELVDKHILSRGQRFFVVSNGHGNTGVVTLANITKIPSSLWPKTPASEVMIPLENTISTIPTAELWTAFEKMGRDGVNQLPVLSPDGANGVVGVLSRDDLVQYVRVLQNLAG